MHKYIRASIGATRQSRGRGGDTGAGETGRRVAVVCVWLRGRKPRIIRTIVQPPVKSQRTIYVSMRMSPAMMIIWPHSQPNSSGLWLALSDRCKLPSRASMSTAGQHISCLLTAARSIPDSGQTKHQNRTITTQQAKRLTLRFVPFLGFVPTDTIVLVYRDRLQEGFRGVFRSPPWARIQDVVDGSCPVDRACFDAIHCNC
jgi:hypothetical protein